MQQLEYLVFDSHPVQYRVPIWQAIEKIAPESIQVVYATISSVTGYFDQGFNEQIAWDEPLLDGYAYTALEAVSGTPFSGRYSLTGKGIQAIIEKYQPKRILLTGLNYQFDLTALKVAKSKGIPISLRCENQDHAFARPFWKAFLRSIYYRNIYQSIDRFYYIGQLNKAHYLKHGVEEAQLFPAHYFTLDRVAGFTNQEKSKLREATRTAAGIAKDRYVIGFSGKLIPKKNPMILFQMLDYLPKEKVEKVVLYFMGSGTLEAELKATAKRYAEKYGIQSVFTGFVNQSKIAQHYLAMDTLVLPSRQMGETWGLVVNEALQAGAGVVVSNHVGSGADFQALERFRIFKDNQAEDLAQKVVELTGYTHEFDWARSALKAYSLEACVEQITEKFSLQHA